jgi:hypothetical protein
LLCSIVAGAACALPAFAQPADFASQPYLGLTVRDGPHGPVVGWVYPGPLGGTGFASESGLQRGDNLVSVNGQAVDAAGFPNLITALRPGDPITIVARRSPQADPQAAVPVGGPRGDEFTVTVTIDTQDNWAGTIKRGLRPGARPGTLDGEPAEGEFEAQILAKAVEAGIRSAPGGPDALLPYLANIQESQPDWHTLPSVAAALRRPLSLDAVDVSITALVRNAASGEPLAISALIAHALDVPDPGTMTGNALNGFVKEFYFPEGQQRSRQQEQNWWGDAERLVKRMRDHGDLFDEQVAAYIGVIRLSMPHAQARLMADLHGLFQGPIGLERLHRDRRDGAPLDEEVIPPGVRAAVTGDILAWEAAPDGRTRILGGPGPNTYDMAIVSEVYDTGGDDVYTFNPAADRDDPLRNARNHTIIDLGGNDAYQSSSDFCGPGVGNFGLSTIDDRGEGNDVYRSTGVCSLASGLFGIGIIIDRGGNDTYENSGPGAGWSLGAGFYGAGLLIDLGGDDTYLGQVLSQGVGGPRGFGAIIDAGGSDLYRANGPHNPSAYATPGVFLGMSQGFGYGIRGYAAGGLGALFDLGGNDRYEAGEFSQGGGYYFGLGILHDFGGHDLYYGNRYGQAFAAHQAAGLLIDDAGDDAYWSITAASQAGAWDQSAAMLIDRAGNDTYRADGLAQGSAAMQAVAVLIDGEGADVYTAAGEASQGQGGGNEYHYDADKAYSFSALLDLGPGLDRFTRGRGAGKATATGAAAGQPGASTYHGVFFDAE